MLLIGENKPTIYIWEEEQVAINLDDAKVLVTGASSGIGWETAKVLASLGCTVAVNGRRSERLAQLVAGIENAGGKAITVQGDLTKKEIATSVVDNAAHQLGGLDIVINNAGLFLIGPVESAPTEEWDRMIQVNLQGFLYVARAALPHLLKSAETNKNKVTDLVNVGSVSGRRPNAGSAVYTMTKWGVSGFSDSLRIEVARRNVRVGLIEPGAVETEVANFIRPEILAKPDPDYMGFEKLQAIDIAETIGFMVTRHPRAAISEVLVRPTGQLV
jgi:NADP-dependent 3-hydroxy acid dehydrogenase YdfG